MTLPDLRASARGVIGILRDWFGERDIGPTTGGTPARLRQAGHPLAPAARFTPSQVRPRLRMCAADPASPAGEMVDWRISKGFSLLADPGGRLRTELAHAQFDDGLVPDLAEHYVAELARRGWTYKRGAWAKPATDHA